MSRELVKKMKALKNDTELALIRGTIASGVASNSAASARRLPWCQELDHNQRFKLLWCLPDRNYPKRYL
jgi:hypothetical protein